MSKITRRRLLALSAALVAAPLAAAAQPAGKVYRIGMLNITSPDDPAVPRGLEAVRQGLRERGWVEGQNVSFEYRWASGKLDLLPELAADLVRSRVDVILAAGGPAAFAASKATSTIPIVFPSVLDPRGRRTRPEPGAPRGQCHRCVLLRRPGDRGQGAPAGR
jgi:putative ABC transport system substrate-binding protein